MAPAQIPHNFCRFSLPLVANLTTALRLVGFNKRLHIRATWGIKDPGMSTAQGGWDAVSSPAMRTEFF
jgi:hypothetical protein